MAKVSVIIPVYNVEQYIERCAHSLFGQTLDDIEYIFIDDCSPDHSIDKMLAVLEQYPRRKEQVTVIRNPRNLKQAGSRNVGMRAATGDYMIHCDPDDWIELDMYQAMLDLALETGSDVTMCDFFLEHGRKTEVSRMHRIVNPHDYINASNWAPINWSLANKLIKSSLIKDNEIYPFDGVNYMEDVGICVRVMYYANQIAFNDAAFYHYNLVNAGSICHNEDFTSNIAQGKRCVEQLEAFFADRSKQFAGFLNTYKLIIKNESLLMTPKDYAGWKHTFPEVKSSILAVKRFNLPFRLSLYCLTWGIKFPYKIYDWYTRTFD